MRFRDYLVLALILLLCLVVQSTWFAALAPFGVIPDLALILVVCVGILRGCKEGALLGFLAGLALDLVSSGYVGFHAVAKMVLGFAFGLTEEKVFKENLLLPAVALWAGTVVHEVFFFVLGLSFGQIETDFWWSLRRIVLPLSFVNALLAPFVYYWLLNWYQSRPSHYGEEKRI